MLMDGRLTFLPCGEGPDAIPVEDSPDRAAAQLLRELGGGGRPVPVLVVRRGATLAEIRHATPEGGSCQGLLSPGLINAQGNEPFWHLRVEGDGATMSTPEQPDGRRLPAGRWVDAGPLGTWRFEAGTGNDQMVLTLRETRCRDGMSGAWFPFVASLEIAGGAFEGCAMEGIGAATPP